MAISSPNRKRSVKQRANRKSAPPKKAEPKAIEAIIKSPKAAQKVLIPTPGKPGTTVKNKAASQSKGRGKQSAPPARRATPQRAQLALTMEKSTQAGTKAATPGKVKKARVPKNLAQQYGEKEKKSRKVRTATATAAAQRKRQDAAARERLRQLMAPTDEVLHRLARAGAITTSLLVTDTNGAAIKPTRSRKATRRPRHWELRCGKCGTLGKFTSAAGVCARCGAIAVRE